MISLSWCQDSTQVTSNAWWDRPHGTNPLGRHPPGRQAPWTDTPRTDIPWTDTPLGRYPPGQTPPLPDTPFGRHPPGQTPPWADTPQIWSMSGWYSSYWNAFLFIVYLMEFERSRWPYTWKSDQNCTENSVQESEGVCGLRGISVPLWILIPFDRQQVSERLAIKISCTTWCTRIPKC